LGEYETSAAKFLGTQFINCALDESGKVDFDDTDEDQMDMGREDDYDDMNDKKVGDTSGESSSVLSRDERMRLVRLVRALVRIGEMSSTIDKHQRRLEDTVKLIVRVTVEEYVFENSDSTLLDVVGSTSTSSSGGGGDNGKNGATMSDAKLGVRLSNMSCESFVSCLNATFDSILSAMKRAGAVHSVVENTLNEVNVISTSCVNGNTPSKEGNEVTSDGNTSPPPSSPPVLAHSGSSSSSSSAASSSSYTSGSRKKTLCEGALKEIDFMKGTPTHVELIAENVKGLRDVCDLAQKSISALLVQRKEVTLFCCFN
jgi:hypothetical protein